MSIKKFIQQLFEQLWDQADQIHALWPSQRKRSHLSSYILFVEGLLGAAASLETDLSQKSAAW